MPKFTIEEHEERMRKILTQAEPVERTGIIRSLLDRVRGVPRLPEEPIPPLEIPELPPLGEPRLPTPRIPRRI